MKCGNCGEALPEESAPLDEFCRECVDWFELRDMTEKREANARYEREALP